MANALSKQLQLWAKLIAPALGKQLELWANLS